jgi:hypothetical protein
MSGSIKIVVFVPITHTDAVRKVMGDMGAGIIGNYSHCSFSSKGLGRFKPSEKANPFIGKVGQLEEVEEERIEIICPKNKVKEIIAAIKKVHPYEEVTFDLYPLVDENEL